MNSFLLWIGGLLVAVLGLLFAAPLVIDWNSYRGVFEEEATRILGRDVRVGGKVDLRLLPSPYVRFEKIRISDAGASLGEPFFRAEGFKLWLAPTPLLRGAVEATELELDRPVLRLAVDDQGRGNWQALRITPGSLPFMPSDIVLQQVRVRQGTVSLKTPGTAEPLTLSGIEGEVAAASLDGPYRFRGTIDWYGSQRELRINTAQREADGKLRYKATVRSVDSSNVYAIDGQLSDTSVKARNTGTLTAKLPLAGVIGSAAPKTSSRTTDVIDLTASFDGDLDGIKLDNLAFSFEQDGKPQLMAGVASADWSKGLRLETRLTSRWLDLDQLAGTSTSATTTHPLMLARRLLGRTAAALPQDGTSLLTIDVDQVNLGGSALSGLRLALARTAGLTSIGELKAALPGNARLELRGTLANQTVDRNTPPEDQAFDGEIVLRGASAQRFSSWAGLSAMLAKGSGADTPFSVFARLGLRPDGMSLTDASGELAGKTLAGGFDWRWDKSRRLDVALEGRSLDLSAAFPGLLYAASLPDETGRIEPPLLAAIAARVAAVNQSVGDMRLQLRAGDITDGVSKLQDVDAIIDIRNDEVSISTLKIGGGATARVDLSGTLSSLSTRPSGSLRGALTSPSPAATAELTRILPASGQSLARRLLRDANRVETSFALDLGGKPDDRLALAASGLIDTTRLRLMVQLDGGATKWRGAPIEAKLDLEGPDAGSIVRNLAATTSPSRSGAAEQRPGRLLVSVAGANAEQAVASAVLDLADTGNATFRGSLAVAPDASLSIKGDVALTATDAARMASFLLGGVRPALSASGLSGDIAIDRTVGDLQLATSNLKLGAADIRGRARFTERADRTRLDATVTSSSLDVGALLGLVLDGRARPKDAATSDTGPSAWSDHPFDWTRIARLEGGIKISAPLARLEDGLELENAELNVGIAPGRIDISGLTGNALGGRVTVRGSLEQAPAGASATLDFRATGANLDRLVGTDGTPPASSSRGQANITVTAIGRSLSPRSLIAALKGSGEIELRSARASGVAPAMVERVAKAMLEANEELTTERLAAVVRAESRRGTLEIGNQKLGLEIADGIARVSPLAITTGEASLRNVTTVDLSALKADSEWQIVARRPWKPDANAKRAEPLATISLVWSGNLAAVARQPPRPGIDALERDLSLRRIEREAERLEDLRRQDEERARIERTRLEEAARAGTPPPAPAQANPPSVSPAQGAIGGPPAAGGTTLAPQPPLPIPQKGPLPPVGTTQPDAVQPAPLPRVVRPPASKSSGAIRKFDNVFTGQ